MSKTSLINTLILALYVVVLAALVRGMWVARNQVLASIDDTHAQADWEEWRVEAQRQHAGAGPVSRREPAREPPTLLLFRDHFLSSTIVLAALTSAVYFALAAFVRGVFTAPAFRPDLK